MSNSFYSLTVKKATFAANTTEDCAFKATEDFKGSGKGPLRPLKGSAMIQNPVLPMPVALGNLLTLAGF